MATNPRTGIAALGSYGGATGTGTSGYKAPSFSANAYGKVPTATATPKSLYEEAAAANPALFALDQKSTGVINSQLSGQLSPETIKTLQDNAATFGVSGGMPGSGLQQNRGLRDLGLSVEQMQQQGLGNYQNALKSLSSMQLDPSLVSGLNTYNNQLAAAPDPAAAAAQEEALYQSHYGQSRAAQAEDAARAEALYQTHYAQNRKASGAQQYPSSGYPSAGGGSSSMFKSNAGAKSTAPNYEATVWRPSTSANPSGGFGGSFTPSSAGGGYAPDWNSGSTSSDPFTSGNIYAPDPIHMGANPDGSNPAGGTGYDSFFPSAPITDIYNENYDAMLDPNSPDYQPGGAV